MKSLAFWALTAQAVIHFGLAALFTSVGAARGDLGERIVYSWGLILFAPASVFALTALAIRLRWARPMRVLLIAASVAVSLALASLGSPAVVVPHVLTVVVLLLAAISSDEAKQPASVGPAA